MFGLFSSKKKAPPKPKTLLEMDSEEQKAAKKDISKQLKESKRAIERQIFESKRMVTGAEKKLQTAIKKGEDKTIQRAYAKNLMSARQIRDR